MKNAIVFCYSVHHKNTLKIAQSLEARCHVKLMDLPCAGDLPDLEEYQLVGFASGIYFGTFGRPMLALVDSLKGLNEKDCFTLYTSGIPSKKFDTAFVKKLESKGAHVTGRFNCRGLHTYGPLKLIGGLSKGHPDGADIEAAVTFVDQLTAK